MRKMRAAARRRGTNEGGRFSVCIDGVVVAFDGAQEQTTHTNMGGRGFSMKLSFMRSDEGFPTVLETLYAKEICFDRSSDTVVGNVASKVQVPLPVKGVELTTQCLTL